MRHLSRVVLVVLLFVSLPSAKSPAQTAPVVPVNLGHSAIPLAGPWKFHTGDNPAWASPAFNDSSWQDMNVAPKAGTFDPQMGLPGYAPGWTAKGHPGYWGYAWYRIRIHLNNADGPLSMLAPVDVDDVYQIFVNGHYIGAFGDFSSSPPDLYVTRPKMFSIPARFLNDGPGGDTTIAFRFYMAQNTLRQATPGGMHDPPLIGFTDAITAAYHVDWEHQFNSAISFISEALIFGLLALLILLLYAFDRTETILLWPLIACVDGAVTYGLFLSVIFTQSFNIRTVDMLNVVVGAGLPVLWSITWWAYFGLQDKKWIRNTLIAIYCCLVPFDLLYQALVFGSSGAPAFLSALNSLVVYLSNAAVLIVLVLILYFGIRQARRVDWILVTAVIIFTIPRLRPALRALHIRTEWFPFGIIVALDLICSLVSLCCFSVVLMRRFRASQRRQQAVLEDVKQAQEVQQVLIPEDLPKIPGLAIESEYRPAREVGGDFFQIIPHPTDGSVLIVAGDVTGKGLKAGMLVAVLVGAIRSAVELNPDPVYLLQALNRRLVGRGDAQATALAMRIAAEGAVTLANAGHLPPYLNGKPVSVDGALPLGFVPAFDPSITRFQLNPGDRLVLISDGVVEATNPQRELFGFDRTQAISNQPAADIADAAESFGQEDDISVIAITLQPQPAAAPA